MIGRIGRSAEGNGLGNDKGKRPHVRKGMVSLLLAAVMVFSAMFIAMSFSDGSDADPVIGDEFNCGTLTELKDAVSAANSDDDLDKITITGNIVLDGTITITKPLIITANSSVVISPVSEGFAGKDVHMTMIWAENTNLTLGESTSSGVLELNGGGICRVVTQNRGYLTVNSVLITNGYNVRNGGGLFVTNGADWEMNGGTIKDNKLDLNSPDYKTDIRFSQDVWCGAATDFTMTGGTIGLILSNSNGGHDGSITMTGGTIGTLYLCDHGPSVHKSTLFYKTGEIDHVLISTVGNTGGDLTTFSYSEVKKPLIKNKDYVSGSHVAKVGKFGYENIQDAYDAAKDGDTITILKDFDVDFPLNITKDICIEVAHNHNTGSSFTLSQTENLLYEVSVALSGGSLTVPGGWINTNGTLTKEYVYGTTLDDIIGEFGEAPNRTGYKFQSWSYANGGTLGSASSKITAVYNAEEYDIHLHHGTDGSNHGSAKVTYDGTLVDIISHAVRDGFKLLGYFTHESGGTMVLNADGTFAAHNVDDHITDGKWSKDAHHTLYAQWAPNEAPSENGYILEIVAGCVIEALIIIGVVAVIRRR